MLIPFKENPDVKSYLNFSIANLERQELGVKSFQEIMGMLQEIKQIIDEMIAVIGTNESVPIAYKESTISVINEFNEHANSIVTYNIDQDPSNFQQRTRIITNVQNWYKLLFQGHDNNRKVNNYLQVYNSLKILSLLSLQKAKQDIDNLLNEASETNRKSNEVLNLLQAKASAESVQDYATIFKVQATKHSYFILKFRPFSLQLGNAQRWLILAVLLIIGFAIFAFRINNIFPIDFTQQASVVTIELLTRLVILSFAIYLISFTLKQFNIQNHLHTLNKHRQNTLNSFKLFIESLDSGDIATRNALMLEVAKAIYESGQSGYISTKDGTDSSPSIIEMTRYLNQK